jgi:hypothetical protein
MHVRTLGIAPAPLPPAAAYIGVKAFNDFPTHPHAHPHTRTAAAAVAACAVHKNSSVESVTSII